MTQTEEQMRKQTAVLREKALEFEIILNNIFAGILLCECDEWLTIRYINGGFTDLTGYTEEDLKNLYQCKYINLVHPDNRSELTKKMHNQLGKGRTYSLEYRIIHKNGQIICVSDKGTATFDRNGKKILQRTLTNISAQKKQEEDLKLSEKRYEIALRVSGVTMFEYDILSGELTLYENTAKMYNISAPIPNGPETLIQQGVVTPESADGYREMYRQIHAGKPSASCYVKTKDADGLLHDFQLILTSIFDEQGTPVKAIGVRKNVYEILQLQKEKDFGSNLAEGKTLIFEANISNDKVEYFHSDWTERIGFTAQSNFSSMIVKVSDMVAPEHKKRILEKLFPEHLKSAYHEGQTSITFDYKFLERDNTWAWYEAFISIIQYPVTGNIGIRFYHTDISETKTKAKRMMEEKRIYEAMISQARLAYEADISANKFISGHEKWQEQYGIDISKSFTHILLSFNEKMIHPEDSSAFSAFFSKNYLLRKFTAGESRLHIQYRRQEKPGEYRWTSCMMHMYEEIETGHIKSFAYVEDIDEQKREELSLKYKAEHDEMTDMYNKSTAEKEITRYLETPEGSSCRHAFLIADIDFFKSVNDTFGHQTGDAVIKEIAEKIKSLFRKYDIIGRIGGDEFCIFMKKIESPKIVCEKAGELCKKALKACKMDGKSCVVSVSVGIAFWDENAITYEKLFKNADKALYMAKKNGRNRYEFFLENKHEHKDSCQKVH